MIQFQRFTYLLASGNDALVSAAGEKIFSDVQASNDLNSVTHGPLGSDLVLARASRCSLNLQLGPQMHGWQFDNFNLDMRWHFANAAA